MTVPTTPEGRRNRLDHLLHKLVEADRNIGYHQQVAATVRQEIQDLMEGLEQLVSESIPIAKPKQPGDTAAHEHEMSVDGGFRCVCGAWFAKFADLKTHIRAMAEEEPEPYRYEAGDGHP